MTQLAERVQRCEVMLAAARQRLDQEAVHQLRVSFRRLQAALRLMGLTEERRALRPLMQLAGEVRNRDIARELAVSPAVRSALLQQRRRHAAGLKQAVLAFQLPLLREQPVQPSPKLLKDFFRAGRRATRKPTAEHLHALRLAGKRLRYAIEYLAASLDASTPARLRDLKRLQDQLGAANDCATARTLIDDADFHSFLAMKEDEQRKRFAEYWRENFGVLGAWESWSMYLAPVMPAK